MKRILLWVWMLTRRLYKKPTFVAILILIPVLVLCYNASAQGESGMLTVALAWMDGGAPEEALMDGLADDSQLLHYVHCDTPEAAEELVRRGKADTAWIFPEDLSEKLASFVEDPSEKNAFVTVLVREDTVALKLSREKLSGAVYSLYARLVGIGFVRENIPGLSHLTDAQLLEYYENTFEGGSLFTYDETDAAMVGAQNTHYLTAPVRGLLAVVIVLCGLASGMYWQEDLRRGTFGWLGRSGKSLAELGCQLVSVANVSAVALLALWLSGMTASFGRELLALVLYGLCVAAFCAMLRRLCGSLRVLGTLLPLLVVVMLVLCPVFFDLGAMRPLQRLLPPTYYLNGVYDSDYLWGLAGYTAVSLAVYQILGLLKRE